MPKTKSFTTKEKLTAKVSDNLSVHPEVNLLFWLLCYSGTGCTACDRGQTKELKELAQKDYWELKDFNFKDSDKRPSFRTDLKDFIKDKSGQTFSDMGIHRELVDLGDVPLEIEKNTFNKLLPSAKISFINMQILVCAAANLRNISIGAFILAFIDSKGHESWTHNHTHVLELIQNLRDGKYKEIRIHAPIIQKSPVLEKLIDIPHYINSDTNESLSPLNHHSTLHGREDDKKTLNDFLDDSSAFEFMFIVGPSGSGKTRLITQWFKEKINLEQWQAGLADKEDSKYSAWNEWGSAPLTCDTLIIVDYVYRYRDVTRMIMDKGSRLLNEAKKSGGNMHRLRLLVLNHNLPDVSSFDELDSFHQDIYGKTVAHAEENYKRMNI